MSDDIMYGGFIDARKFIQKAREMRSRLGQYAHTDAEVLGVCWEWDALMKHLVMQGAQLEPEVDVDAEKAATYGVPNEACAEDEPRMQNPEYGTNGDAPSLFGLNEKDAAVLRQFAQDGSLLRAIDTLVNVRVRQAVTQAQFGLRPRQANEVREIVRIEVKRMLPPEDFAELRKSMRRIQSALDRISPPKARSKQNESEG